MINEKSLQAVEKAKFSKNFCRPLYSSYCFSQIPLSIASLFSGDFSVGLPPDVYGGNKAPFDHVVLLLLDGFGWTFFEKYKSHIPFLKKQEPRRVVSKITTLFPSTTAAHITCINTGLDPSQSGIYEWFIYEPKLNEIIAPLLFSFAGDHENKTLEKVSFSPQDLYPQKTIYHQLQQLGVKSFAFQPAALTDSPYSKSILDGAETIGYSHPKTGFEQMLQRLKGKTYTYFYFGEIDAVGHREGVFSHRFASTIENIFSEIEIFASQLPPKTALIITADHGMVEVSPTNTYYINKKIPNIEKYLLYGEKKKPLAPAGSCRDFFLHAHKDRVGELKEILQEFIGEMGEVYLTEELIEDHFFGLQTPSENFTSRVGNLVILPYKGEAVWWLEKNRFQQNFHAAHGGLTREEMETLFLFQAQS